MTRSNTNTNYGATRFAPPPYSGFEIPSGQAQHDSWSQVDPPRSTSESSIICKILSWTNTRSFVVLLTSVIVVGLCMTTMPVTYCNDPADPQVRERIREEWSKELLKHEKKVAERVVVTAKWAWEDEHHTELLREWDQERVQHEQELRERARREEDERKRHNLFWSHMEAHQCKTYGTREYTAVLMNLPVNWERRVEACKATPLEIHGVARTPKSCEARGDSIVFGRWEVDQNEPDCNTSWGWYKDKGCTSLGSGRRRIEHYLENLPKGSDWRDFCATTPARFLGMEFVGAQECFQYKSGTYGYWEIDDSSC